MEGTASTIEIQLRQVKQTTRDCFSPRKRGCRQGKGGLLAFEAAAQKMFVSNQRGRVA
jgi:hypothetical protein